MRLIISFIFIAFTVLAQAFEVPSLTGPVMDQTGLLSPMVQRNLTDDLLLFRQKTRAQIQVFVVSSLNGEPIENVTIQVFDQWKLGDEKTDTGILFLVAPNDKKMRIEVGQGYEGAVPDVIAKRIISEVVRPFFQKGQFEVGIQAGVASLQNYILTGEAASLESSGQQHQKNKIPAQYLLFGFGGLFLLIFLFSPALAMQILFALLSGGRGGGRGGYSGGGGGGWSGGGGSSSGGGASGDW